MAGAATHTPEPASLSPPPIEDTTLPNIELRPAVAPALVHEDPMPRNAPELPRISLELPPDSGLVLVETSHGDPGSPATEEPEAQRPRRVRPPRVETHDEPLQMVETTHKDSTPSAE